MSAKRGSTVDARSAARTHASDAMEFGPDRSITHC